MILFLMLSVFFVTCLIFSCKKTSNVPVVESKTNSAKVENRDSNAAVNAKNLPGNKTAGASCNCGGGYSSCSSTCIFSDCCVCWDPKVSDGACGCYWGISTCRTAPKSTARTIQNKVLDQSSRTIHIHPLRLNKYFSYLESLKLNINGLKEKYNKFDKSGIDEKNDKLEIPPSSFDDFMDTYKIFIASLDQNNLSIIKTYIDQHQ